MNNKVLALFFLMPAIAMGQFGFERMNDIPVIKNSITQRFPWAGGLDHCQFSNIDLDLDGTEDLFVYDKSSDKIVTFLQKGTAGQMNFEHAPQYENDFPDVYGWCLLVDYDGDGKKDLFAASPGGAIVYRNISTQGTKVNFTLASQYLPSTIYGNPSYVYCSQADTPAIVDVDGDGDVDILSFYLGSCVRYYKNISQETYGHSDSLLYETVSVCYGNFIEHDTNNLVTLNDCCSGQVTNPQMGLNTRPVWQNEDRHSGSTVLALDLDADQMMDLVIGDISYNNFTMLMNGGTTPNTNSAMVSQDPAFPSYDVPVDMQVFPSGFYVDVNNDQKRDLVVSPNTALNSENYASNWLYLNEGADNFPDFNFNQKDFLQDDMIEYGARTMPVFFDHNGDGLKDLIVAVSERFDSVTTNFYSKLIYYKNTGTANAAAFTLESEDYLGLSSFNGGNHLHFYPTFGDVNGDGAEDLILAEYNGSLTIFINSNPSGVPAQFVNYTTLKDQAGVNISHGILIAPKLVDLNRDGLMDLVIGKRDGTLTYYKNVGTPTNYSFELQTNTLGGVSVVPPSTNEGTAVPEFVLIDSVFHLIVGSRDGYLHYYNNISNNLNGTFNLVDAALHKIWLGPYSAPAIYDVDQDYKLEMVVGNKRGGLGLYQSALVSSVGIVDYQNEINIYPNPAENNFNIDLSKLNLINYQAVSYSLMDMSGKALLSGNINQSQTLINCKDLSEGVYLLNLQVAGYRMTKKIIIQ
ncbi:hypothetical protein DNU06_08585 [Putridiphycobacter roseus]|uniref:Secretion system C-terminal sorting domain-containing protein n=1 Tax=Putridiphycobacter roseus TaxID=2219161 RepID=A0A2W1MZH6_9FLAO|nr:T9SS type A sorting domain-containing protein [Putridiphycobacter roseus]PZE17317.1 hypothetical protein DNU06_08585 [Putridiphycobacter roseus]